MRGSGRAMRVEQEAVCVPRAAMRVRRVATRAWRAAMRVRRVVTRARRAAMGCAVETTGGCLGGPRCAANVMRARSVASRIPREATRLSVTGLHAVPGAGCASGDIGAGARRGGRYRGEPGAARSGPGGDRAGARRASGGGEATAGAPAVPCWRRRSTTAGRDPSPASPPPPCPLGRTRGSDRSPGRAPSRPAPHSCPT